MATNFIIGDYKYTVIDETTNVRVEVVDITKSSYSDIPASVTYEDVTYNVTDMYTTFFGCTFLTTAPTIPSSVTNMSSTFRRCTSLTTAPTIPSSVTSTDHTFYGCTNLTGTIYVENIPNLYEDMFTGTTKSIYLIKGDRIPDGVTHEEFDNFWLNSVAMSYNNIDYTYDWFSPEGSDYVYTIVNSLFVKTKVKDKTKTSYANLVNPVLYDFTESGSSPISYTLNSLTDTFKNCSALTTAPTIPSSVTNMINTFSGCTSLTTAPAIPSGVTNMQGTFRDCTSLTNVPVDLIPSSVRNMGYIFDGCTNLTNVPTIPSGVIDMSYAFNGCTNLINNSIISIPSSVKNMKQSFRECTSLHGDIEVRNTPTNFALMFRKTNNDIYIVNRSGSSSPWTTIADTYPNVHYELNDFQINPINLTYDRGAYNSTTESWESDDVGLDLKLSYKDVSILSDLHPVGWVTDISKTVREFYKNNVITNPVVTTNTYAIDQNIGREKYTYTVELTVKFYEGEVDESTDPIRSKIFTYSVIVPSVFALLNFRAGGKGMAIGTIATQDGVEIIYPTKIGKGLVSPQAKEYFLSEDTSVDSSKTYYAKSGNTYIKVNSPTGNPSTKGYYEMRYVEGTIDLENYQFIVGQYNKVDNDSLFVIGNGEDEDNRSNLMTVGNNFVRIGSDLEMTSVLDSLSIPTSAFTLGSRVGVKGPRSIAMGRGLYAESEGQFVIGKYNIQDANNEYAFILGNGVEDDVEGRSNAMTIDWNGLIQCRGISSLDNSYKEIYVGNYTGIIQSRYGLTSTDPDDEWLDAAIKLICYYYQEKKDTIFKGKLGPNSQGYFEIYIYDTDDLQYDRPKYSFGTWRKYADTFWLIKTSNYLFSYVAK